MKLPNNIHYTSLGPAEFSQAKTPLGMHQWDFYDIRSDGFPHIEASVMFDSIRAITTDILCLIFGYGSSAVSYTHLTLPTILRV